MYNSRKGSRRAFDEYNPFIQGLYSILLEYDQFFNLHQQYETDKVIRNEIQLVLRNLNISTSQLIVSTILRDFTNNNLNNAEVAYQKNKINSNPLIRLPEAIASQQVPQDQAYDPSQYQGSFDKEKEIVVNESSQAFPHINPEILRQLANEGISIAMKEIIEAVIKRVIPIAAITTRTLILKDFKYERCPQKFKRAAESTSKALAGMLAQIT